MVSKNSLSKKIFFVPLIIALVTIGNNNLCQDLPGVSQGNFKFYFDSNSFYGNRDSTYQEFYLMFYTDQFENLNNNLLGKQSLNISTKIFNVEGNLIDSKNWTIEVELDTNSVSSNEMVSFDQWGRLLAPGKYETVVSLTDTINHLSGNVKANLDVKEITDLNLELSDIQLVLKTYKMDAPSIFKKGGLVLYPNVWRRYGVLNPQLIFYYEIYGIDTKSDEPLYVDYKIINSNNIEARKIGSIEIVRNEKQKSVTHSINVDALPTDIYNLLITVKDLYNNSVAISSKNFEIIQLDYNANKSRLSNEDIELFDQLFSYLADESEYKFYNKLDASAKEVFIVDYWSKKDPIPETEENEYLLNILKRFHYANDKYSWGSQPGWKTDQGRVLIKYGMPTEIESHYSDPSTVPYEIWEYQLEKNYIFVFIDRNSNGRFILTHSNMIGEVSNPYWLSLAKE